MDNPTPLSQRQEPAAGTAPPFKRREWTTLEVRRLKQLYPDMLNTKVAAQLQRTVSSITSKANDLGLHKSPAFFHSQEACRFKKNSGMATRFRKRNEHITDDQESGDACH